MHQVLQTHVPQSEFCAGFPGLHCVVNVAKCQDPYSKESFALEACASVVAPFSLTILVSVANMLLVSYRTFSAREDLTLRSPKQK